MIDTMQVAQLDFLCPTKTAFSLFFASLTRYYLHKSGLKSKMVFI